MSADGVIGVYAKPAQIQAKRGSNYVQLNERTFIKGGINKALPPYLVGEAEWIDSTNIIFDHEKACILAPRTTLQVLTADALNIQTDCTRNDSICVGKDVPFPPNCFPPGSPIFDECGAQAWPSMPVNIPYFNSGNNTTGFIKYHGPDTLVSDGTTINSLGIPFVGQGTFYTFPITVIGDFTASFEVYPETTGAVINFYWAILDIALQRGANFGYQGNVFSGQKESLFSTACDYIGNLDGIDRDRIDGPLIPNDDWTLFTLQRVGTVMTTYINGVQGISYDFQGRFGVNLGINYVTASSVLRLRNISVQQP